MKKFDPYHVWLGIPPEEQPPNHYRLLGISLFESDRDVIRNAADQRMTYLRTYAGGQHSELSQQLLNEVSAAKVCLLNEVKKREYDESLGQVRASGSATRTRQASATPTSQPQPQVDLAQPWPNIRPDPPTWSPPRKRSHRGRERSRRRKVLVQIFVLICVLFVVFFVGRNTSVRNASTSPVDVEVTQLRARIVKMHKDLSELRNRTIKLRSVVDLSNSTEEWTRGWRVLNTREDARWVPKGAVGSPSAGRRGVLELHPVSRDVPASIGRVVMLDGPSPKLKLGVSGHRYGDWLLRVKINGRNLRKDQVISGAEGWLDIPYGCDRGSARVMLGPARDLPAFSVQM